MSRIVVKWFGFRFANVASGQATLTTAAAQSLKLPGESGMSPRSAGQILGVHSAWACQAALSSVQEIEPNSSELPTRLTWEKGNPCRTKSWRR